MNRALLQAKIKQTTMTPIRIADRLNISLATFYNKVYHCASWKTDEIVALAELLGWSEKTLLEIIEFKGGHKK